MHAQKITKQYLTTVGKAITIDPVVDAGYTHGELTSMTGLLHENSPYNAFVTSDFTCSTVNPGSIHQFYIITPLKKGTWTFMISVNVTQGHKDVVYTITAVDVTNISLNFQELTLKKGQSETITPTITDSNAETSLNWVSSDNSVATVTQNGKVTANGIGTAIITCTAHNGVSAQCIVTVKPQYVTGVNISETNSTLTIGDSHQLTVSILPADATDKSVTWSSTNEAVAVVNENGLVTALKSGSCQIKATANDGSGKAASCLLTVLGNVMYCDDIVTVPTAKVTLPIRMKNEDAIQGFEFKLVLPTGTSVVEKNGKPYATLSARFSSAEGLECVYLNDNTYQFVYTSASRIEGSSGIVVKVPLAVSSNMAEGTYEVKIKDVEMVQYATSAQIHHSDRTSKLTINKLLLGDVNGDSRISVADAISIINYVLGRTPASFITKAADVNGDNSISLADAVAVVDIILKRDASSAVKSIKDIIIDPQ